MGNFNSRSWLLLLLSLLLKPAAQVQVEKKIVYKLLLQLHNHLRYIKLKKHNSGKQPTVDCPLKTIQRSGVKHSVR